MTGARFRALDEANAPFVSQALKSLQRQAVFL